ncbi:MAG: hypothetical protein AAGA62_19360, partial [Bacteroidota bacterium]
MSLYSLLVLISALLAVTFYFSLRKSKSKSFVTTKRPAKRSNPLTSGLFVLALLGAGGIAFATFATPEVGATVTIEEEQQPQEVATVVDTEENSEELAGFS